jgi:penicillin-binding protein 1A
MARKIIKGLWIFLGVLSLLTLIVFFSIAHGWIGYMPDVEELENPNYKFATEILSEDGVVLGTWSLNKENRVYSSYRELPQSIIQALIATEDIRFREHSGIDAKALLRAIVKRGIFQQKNAGGGSTITQQLAKQLFTEEQATSTMQRLFQKPIEWVIAVKLERFYTKEEILTMYLNKFDFLNNAVGIKTASFTYFGCEPKDLTIEESATLVGMCKNSSYFNPVRYNERTRDRRNVVLDQMRKAGYLSDAQCDSLQQLPLVLHYHRVDHKQGLATYFREYLRIMMTAHKPLRRDYPSYDSQKYYEDSLAWETNPLYGWCDKNRKSDGTNYNIYTDGLKIYTTINSHMQKYAEEAVSEHLGGYLQPLFFKEKQGRSTAPFTNKLSSAQVNAILDRYVRQSSRYHDMKAAGASDEEIHKAFRTPEQMSVFTWHGERDTIMTPLDSIRYYQFYLRAGFLSMDPMTGYVKAYVGGPNYNYFQYDMAMVGRRQVGSTIKPFLYSLAMENGYSPCDVTRNVEQTLIDENGNPWTPRNSNRRNYGQVVTLKWGLANSNNWISAYLMSKLSPTALVRLIHSFGVLNRNIQSTISLCLGPCDISVGEMVSAYTAFADKGIRVSPLFVTKIEDSKGNVISTFTPRMSEVISANSAYKMLVMLREVVNHGTAGRIRRQGITADMGGKTGTSNNNSDGWFIGFTPSLVSGVWVGGENRDIHFDSMIYGQGASMALPIWVKYMKKVYADRSLKYSQGEKFQIPDGFDPCGSNLPPDTGSPQATEESIDDLFE